MTNLLAAMYSRPDGSDGRESRDIYVANKDSLRVEKYTGWKCTDHEGKYNGHWWCPDYGYSVFIGGSAFFTEVEARAKLQEIIVAKEKKIQEAWNTLYIPIERRGT